MTEEQKSDIISFRLKGMTYSEIAKKLNISINTAKSFYRRTEKKFPQNLCRQCGVAVIQPKGVRKKIFCSDECRMLWWKQHNDEIKKNAVYDFKCKGCGKHFQTYGNNHRKYCSRECYINERFGGKADEQH